MFDAAYRDFFDQLDRRAAPAAPMGALDSVTAAWTAAGLNDPAYGQVKALNRPADELDQALEAATGKNLVQFMDSQGLAWDKKELANWIYGRVRSETLTPALRRRLSEAVNTLPEEQRTRILPHLGDPDASARAGAQAIEARDAEAWSGAYSLSAQAAYWVGSLARQAASPINLAASVVPGSGAAGAIGLRYFARKAAEEALAGAAAQAVQEPAVQSGRAGLGLEHGLGQAAENVLSAASGAALFGFAGRALGHYVVKPAWSSAWSAARRLGRDAPGAAESAPAAIPPDLPLAPADLDAAALHAEAREIPAASTPPGTSAHGRHAIDMGVAGALRSLEDPRVDPPRPVSVPVATDVLHQPGMAPIQIGYRVIEAADLVVSHDATGRANPAFPEVLQPRDRARPAAVAWANETAAKLNPDLLLAAPTAREGAPVIGPDRVVESGNGRAIAIREAYARNPERAEAYRATLARQGYDITGFREPVLVRERLTPMTDGERVTFTREANRTATARLSAVEQALADAPHVAGVIRRQVPEGSLTLARNTGIARDILGRIATPEELGDLITRDGRLSQAGTARLEAALVAQGWAAPDVVARLFEATDPNARAILGALADVAPVAARVRASADPAAVRTLDAVVDAFRLVERARDNQLRVGDLVNQIDLERGAVPDDVAAAVRLFFRDDGLRQAAGREKVAERLESLIAAADKMADGPDLFGTTVTSDAAFSVALRAGETLIEQPIAGHNVALADAPPAASVRDVSPIQHAIQGRSVNAHLQETVERAVVERAAATQILDEFGDFEVELAGADGAVAKVSARQLLADADADAAAAAEFADCLIRTGVAA